MGNGEMYSTSMVEHNYSTCATSAKGSRSLYSSQVGAAESVGGVTK